MTRASQVTLVIKNQTARAGDLKEAVSIPGLGRSSGGEHSNPLQSSCLENPKDRGAWQATVYRVARMRHDLATKPQTNKDCTRNILKA